MGRYNAATDIQKMVLGSRVKRMNVVGWDVGGEMIAILLAYAAFWSKQHKIPFERECCRPLAFDGIVANLPQGAPHLLQLNYQ